jgi:hypothetical protein
MTQIGAPKAQAIPAAARNGTSTTKWPYVHTQEYPKSNPLERLAI